MSGKGSDILHKLIAAGLFVASIGFFANIDRVGVYIVPGVLFAAAGFVLALRRERSTGVLPDPELDRRLAQISETLSATHAELAATQERVERLMEERDFMRQLARPLPARAAAEVAPSPAELPPPPRAPELRQPSS